MIYADTLLIVNFSMDFLALFIAGKLLRAKISPVKLAPGALIGAVYSLFSVMADVYLSSAISSMTAILGGILCALLMVLVSFGGSLRGVVGAAVTYGAVNVGLGGVMTAIYGFVGRTASRFGLQSVSASPDASPVIFAVITVISGAVSLVYARLTERRTSRKRVTVTIGLGGKTAEATLLCDSGNLLREPFCGKPVIIVSAEFLEGIAPELAETARCGVPELCDVRLRGRLRLIPADGVMGRGMLIGFVPEILRTDGRSLDAVIAVDPTGGDYDGCEGIIPGSLVTI